VHHVVDIASDLLRRDMGDSPLRSALLKSELFRSRVDTTKEVVSRAVLKIAPAGFSGARPWLIR